MKLNMVDFYSLSRWDLVIHPDRDIGFGFIYKMYLGHDKDDNAIEIVWQKDLGTMKTDIIYHINSGHLEYEKRIVCVD